jgi:dynein heavy chain
MASLFQKKDSELTEKEYIIKNALLFLGMKKIKPEAVEKIMSEASSPIQDFVGPASFLFFNATGADAVSVLTTMPAPSSIKKKCLICLKARDSTEDPGFACIEKEIIYMEVNRPVLENLYQTCNNIYLPILRNPLNQMGWSDLVSKDLIEKFDSFLSHTYVTIGQVKGQTMLPVPPSDAANSSQMSSKDKATQLENAIAQWTK